MKIIKEVGLFCGIVSSIFFVSFMVLAWNPPGATPTGGNVALPINVGSNSQTKSGNLRIINWLGIGSVSNPLPVRQARLDIDGQIRIRGGNPGTGKVLVSDSNGVGSWQTPASAPISSVFGRTGSIVAQSGDYASHYLSRNVNTWITSADGQPRFLFAGKSSTYITGPTL